MTMREVSRYGDVIASALDVLALEVECTADAELIARRADEWRAEARNQQVIGSGQGEVEVCPDLLRDPAETGKAER